LERLDTQPTSGLILEVLGTQGVGKTTLNNTVYQSIRSRWFLRGDVAFNGPTALTDGPIERLHRELLFRRIDAIRAGEPDLWKSVGITKQMAIIAYESLLMSTQTYPRGFLLDEGLFKNYFREVLEIDPHQAAPLWKQRAFVHLRARDPAFAAARYKKRVDFRRRTGAYQHEYSMEEVIARIDADTEICERLCRTAEEIGRPVLTIYAEDDFDACVAKVLRFESSLWHGMS
jgi:hypothetical protein